MKTNILKILLVIAVGVIATACDEEIADRFGPIYVNIEECSEETTMETLSRGYVHIIEVSQPKEMPMVMKLRLNRLEETSYIGSVVVSVNGKFYCSDSDMDKDVFEYDYDSTHKSQSVKSKWFDAEIKQASEFQSDNMNIVLRKNSDGENVDSVMIHTVSYPQGFTFIYTDIRICFKDV